MLEITRNTREANDVLKSPYILVGSINNFLSTLDLIASFKIESIKDSDYFYMINIVTRRHFLSSRSLQDKITLIKQFKEDNRNHEGETINNSFNEYFRNISLTNNNKMETKRKDN